MFSLIQKEPNNMKILTKTMLLLLLSISSFNIFAQGKKTVFPSFPQSIVITEKTLQEALSVGSGQSISIHFNDQFSFTGTVLSNEMKYANLQTMMIRSASNEAVLCQLSKMINKDKSVRYVGRIIDPFTSEVFEIKNEKAGTYTLQRNSLEKIFQNCSN